MPGGLELLECESSLSLFWWINELDLNVNPGSSLESAVFSASSEQYDKWTLVCYPNGNDAKERGHLGLFLRNKSGYDISCCSSLALVDAGGKHHYKTVGTLLLHPRKTDLGFARFASHQDLKNDNLVVKGVLTVYCKVFSSSKPEEAYFRAEESRRLCDDMVRLASDATSADVEIVVGCCRIPVHSTVLSARSRVFEAMLKTDMVESATKVIEISDFEKEVVLKIVEFVYTGSVSRLELFCEKLIFAADKYCFDGLKEMCAFQLWSTLTVENVCQRLTTAKLLNLPRSSCMDFLVENLEGIIRTPGFTTMVTTHPDLAVEALSLHFTRKQ